MPSIEDAAALRDLLASLWLYTRRHTWTQLTSEQKELFADVVDFEHQRPDREDGAPMTEGIERWWRK